MALPTFVAAGTAVSGTGALTPTLPAGWATNDIFVIEAETAQQDFGTWPPTGWSAVPNVPSGIGTAGGVGGVKLHLAWKRATGSESAPTITAPADHAVIQIFAFRGCVTSGSPWSDSIDGTGQPAGTAVSWSSISPTGNEQLILFALAGNRDVATAGDVTGVTNASGAVTNLTALGQTWVSTGQGGGIAMFSGTQETAGASGATTATITSQTFIWWTGALIPAVTYAQRDVAPEYDRYYWAAKNLLPEYDVITGGNSSNGWFKREQAGSPTWFGWNAVTPKDVSPDWDMQAKVYKNSATVEYTIVSSSGTISGGGMLPYASAQGEMDPAWSIFTLYAEEDAEVTYAVHTTAEAEFDCDYEVFTGAERDVAPTWHNLGPVTQDVAPTYAVIQGVERDVSPSWTMRKAVSQDSAVTYTVFTNPFTAGQNSADVTYNVIGTAFSEAYVAYRVLDSAEADQTNTYGVLGGAERDVAPTWELAGTTLSDGVVTYEVLGLSEVEENLQVRYNVINMSIAMPSLVGLTYSKAQQAIIRAGLQVGSVTYQ
jgi:hypothetical protein